MFKYPIEAVLPHRAPMILIDAIDRYSKESCRCSVMITEESPFYDTAISGVPSYIGCEYMAQAIAALSGAIALDEKRPVTIGFLLGARKYQTEQPVFTVGSRLIININQLYLEESGLGVYQCEILDAQQQLLAQAKINVFLPADSAEFLKDSYE